MNSPEPPLTIEQAVTAIALRVQSASAKREAQKRELAQAVPQFNRTMRDVERALLESSIPDDHCDALVANIRGLIVVAARLSRQGATVLNDGMFKVE